MMRSPYQNEVALIKFKWVLNGVFKLSFRVNMSYNDQKSRDFPGKGSPFRA